MGKTKKIALMAVFTAIALTIFMIEAQIPAPVPIPGVKLGLANIITLIAMQILGRREAGVILLARIVMGAMFAGNMGALIYSLTGGVFAYTVMCLCVKLFPEKLMWVVSILAAIAHNVGQLLACTVILKTPSLWVYAPVLAVSAIITGLFTGVAAMYLVRALRKLG